MLPPLDARGPDPADDDAYGLSEPEQPRTPPVPEVVPAYVRAKLEHRERRAPPPLRPPRRPMIDGTLIFPFYPCALAPWMVITGGLVFSGYLLLILWGPAAQLGALGLRTMGPPAYGATMMTLAYAFTACLKMIEETSHGLDSVECEPDLNWKEWFYSFAYVAFLLLQAGAVGMAVKVVALSEPWWPMAAVTLVVFPWVLLGSLAAGGAWAPVAIGDVVRSVPGLWRQWGLFYLQTTAIALVWTLLTVGGLRLAPWVMPLYSAPILGAGLLIYARLVGRLAWCIAQQQEQGGNKEE